MLKKTSMDQKTAILHLGRLLNFPFDTMVKTATQ